MPLNNGTIKRKINELLVFIDTPQYDQRYLGRHESQNKENVRAFFNTLLECLDDNEKITSHIKKSAHHIINNRFYQVAFEHLTELNPILWKVILDAPTGNTKVNLLYKFLVNNKDKDWTVNLPTENINVLEKLIESLAELDSETREKSMLYLGIDTREVSLLTFMIQNNVHLNQASFNGLFNIINTLSFNNKITLFVYSFGELQTEQRNEFITLLYNEHYVDKELRQLILNMKDFFHPAAAWVCEHELSHFQGRVIKLVEDLKVWPENQRYVFYYILVNHNNDASWPLLKEQLKALPLEVKKAIFSTNGQADEVNLLQILLQQNRYDLVNRLLEIKDDIHLTESTSILVNDIKHNLENKLTDQHREAQTLETSSQAISGHLQFYLAQLRILKNDNPEYKTRFLYFWGKAFNTINALIADNEPFSKNNHLPLVKDVTNTLFNAFFELSDKDQVQVMAEVASLSDNPLANVLRVAATCTKDGSGVDNLLFSVIDKMPLSIQKEVYSSPFRKKIRSYDNVDAVVNSKKMGLLKRFDQRSMCFAAKENLENQIATLQSLKAKHLTSLNQDEFYEPAHALTTDITSAFETYKNNNNPAELTNITNRINVFCEGNPTLLNKSPSFKTILTGILKSVASLLGLLSIVGTVHTIKYVKQNGHTFFASDAKKAVHSMHQSIDTLHKHQSSQQEEGLDEHAQQRLDENQGLSNA